MPDADTSPAAPVDLPVDAWLARLAARQPTPGGGAVAALAGALASAVGEMALRFSHARKGNPLEADAAIEEAVDALVLAREAFLGFCEADQRAYAAWRVAKALPADDPARDPAFAAATRESIAVPMGVIELALATLGRAIDLAPHANPWLASDLLACGDLATAAVRVGRYNVLANCGEDPALQEFRTTADAHLAEAIDRVRRLGEAVAARTGTPM